MFSKKLIVLAVVLVIVVGVGFTVQNQTDTVNATASQPDITQIIERLQESRLTAKEAQIDRNYRSALPRPEDYSAMKDAQLEQIEMRHQQLMELNQIYYPSPSEPTFWNGQPH